LESAPQKGKMLRGEVCRSCVIHAEAKALMTPMMNMCDTIRENLHFNRFAVPMEEEAAGVGTSMDYFAHVLSGRKTCHTTEGTWTRIPFYRF
jgi:hypothetical protein